jgi:hypothetical protein
MWSTSSDRVVPGVGDAGSNRSTASTKHDTMVSRLFRSRLERSVAIREPSAVGHASRHVATIVPAVASRSGRTCRVRPVVGAACAAVTKGLVPASEVRATIE